MTGWEWPIALFLLANLVVALLASARGPTAADRMVVALLFSTSGVAILVLLAHGEARPFLTDVALVLALLAAISGIAFARRAWQKRMGQGDDD